MATLFLLPAIKDSSREKASGGSISNNRLILGYAKHEKVIIAPILQSLVANDLEKNPNIEVLQPEAAGTGRISYILSRYLLYPRQLHQILKAYNPDQIIATRAAIPLGYRAAARLSIPFKIITRAFEDHEQAGLREPSDGRTVYRYIEGVLNRRDIIHAYREASGIIVNSRFMEKVTRNTFNTAAKFEIRYPEIDLPLGTPKSKPITSIGFVTKGSRKGLRLVEDLARCLPDIEFHIFGATHDGASKLKNMHNDGYINDRIDLFSRADLFLMPSAWEEPYGRVAAEAIWRGIPVLVSKKGGLQEATPSSYFWVEEDTTKAWEERILELSKNPVATEEHVLRCQAELAKRQPG